MRKASVLWPGMAAAGALGAAMWVWLGSNPALAQPSPRPQECVCSPGVSLTGGNGGPVLISHCQCGILTCAVVVPSGQLQCAR